MLNAYVKSSIYIIITVLLVETIIAVAVSIANLIFIQATSPITENT
jgi:hypothetical protein